MLDLLPSVALRRFLLVAIGFSLALLALPRMTAAQDSDPAVQVPDTVDAVVQVRGMMCSNCARRMKGALEGIGAVETADVQLKEQRALLTLEADRTVTETALRTAVTEAGYAFRTVTFAEAERSDPSSGL
jgi:copper chaperone CopZ